MRHPVFVLQWFKLTILRLSPPTRQEAANPSQESPSASNSKVSKAVFTHSTAYSGSAGTPIPSSKCDSQEQRSVYPICRFGRVGMLTSSRHHSDCNPPTNPRHLLANENENGRNRKNRKAGVTLPKRPNRLLRSNQRYYLRAVLLRKKYPKRRPGIPEESIPTVSSIGSKLGGGTRKILSKTARSGHILRGASLRNNSSNWSGFKSRTQAKHQCRCTVSTLCSISLRGRSLPCAARLRNHPFRHLAINCRAKSKALNTKARTMQFRWREWVATCAGLL